MQDERCWPCLAVFGCWSQVQDQHLKEHWPEVVVSLQKDIRVYQLKLRRLKVGVSWI